MKRRSFMTAAAAAPLLSAVPFAKAGAAPDSGTTGSWRTFELTTAVTIGADVGGTRVWLPLPHDSAYQRVESVTWSGNAAALGIYTDVASGVRAFHAAWSDGEPRTVTLMTRVATLDRRSNLNAASAGAIPEDIAKFLKPNAMITTDGIVKETADKIVKGQRDPVEKAQAIYDWIVENTFRDPKVKGCGIGDIRAMLVSGNLGGKCADLNALFVGLARAAGIPARGVYGVRVAPSAFYSAMGTRSADISKAQHCRAEFWVAGIGWIPADPADIRKVVLDDKLALTDPRMPDLRRFLFGAWEGNWIAFNHARDVRLAPGDTVVNYFMYPEGDTAKGQLDGMDPDAAGYKIVVRPVSAT